MAEDNCCRHSLGFLDKKNSGHRSAVAACVVCAGVHVVVDNSSSLVVRSDFRRENFVVELSLQRRKLIFTPSPKAALR